MDATALAMALRDSTMEVVFTSEVMDSIAPDAKWKNCCAGTSLFREGDRSDSLYIIHRGNVLLEMCLPARGCSQLLTLGPGEIVAWSALVGDGRMTAGAVAVDDVQLIEFSGTALLRRCEADTQFGYRLMRQMAAALAKRLLATRLQMLDLFSADAKGSDDTILNVRGPV